MSLQISIDFDAQFETIPIESLTLSELATSINIEFEEANKAFDLADRIANWGIKRAYRCGQMLVSAKAKVKHGEWQQWLGENCNISHRTAQQYMRLSKMYREDNLPQCSIKEALGNFPKAYQGTFLPSKKYEWDADPDRFRKLCEWDDIFLAKTLAMDSLGIPEETIALATGRSCSCIQRATNPQLIDRCLPYKSKTLQNGDELDNNSTGETLLSDGIDAEFLKKAYPLDRDMQIGIWRSRAFLSAAISMSGMDFKEATPISEVLKLSPILALGYAKESQKADRCRRQLWGLGMVGVTDIEYFFIADFCKKDALWAIGLREDPPRCDWIARAKFYAQVSPPKTG